MTEMAEITYPTEKLRWFAVRSGRQLVAHLQQLHITSGGEEKWFDVPFVGEPPLSHHPKGE